MRNAVVSILLVMCVAGISFAEDETAGVVVEDEAAGIGVDVSLDFFSKYVWRGQLLNDDYAFQPGVSVNFDKFTFGVWGSVDMTDYSDNEWEFIEYDYSLDYTTSIAEGIDLSVGVIAYYFPSLGDTQEIYAGLAFDVPLSPSVTIYNDVDEINGSYVSFAVGHTFEEIAKLSEDVSVPMEIGASIGWGSKSYNKGYWGDVYDNSGLNDLAVGVAFPIGLGSWTFTPSINYVTLLDNDAKDSDAYSTSSDYFFTGLSFSTSF